MTRSTWAPHPAQVTLPHARHVVARHTGHLRDAVVVGSGAGRATRRPIAWARDGTGGAPVVRDRTGAPTASSALDTAAPFGDNEHCSEFRTPIGAGVAASEVAVTATAGVRARRRERTRADILAAAWELAERDGIAGVSLRELAPAVGMRAPSLYTYFDGKSAIYDAMFAEGFRALDAAEATITVDPSDPAGSVAHAIEVFLEFCTASVPRYQLLFTRAIPDWEPSPDAYAVSQASFARTVAWLAELGIDDPVAVDLMTAVTSGLAAQQLANDPGGRRWTRLAREAAEMFVQHTRRS
jgi:AcrR family transcriptional regulator